MHRYQIPYIIILCLILLSCSSGRSVTPTWTQQDTLILALKEKCPSQSPSISPPIFEPDTCLHMQVNANIVRRLTYQKNGLVKYVCQDCGETLSQEETSRLTGKVLYGYAEIQAILDGFYDRYGIDYESIGKSVDGRNIYVYRLGDTSAEHHILVQAGIHGKEYMNTALMLNLTEYYLLNGDTLFQGKTRYRRCFYKNADACWRCHSCAYSDCRPCFCHYQKLGADQQLFQKVMGRDKIWCNDCP